MDINQGVYATGSRSGLRDPSRPNWKQVIKAKNEAAAKENLAKLRKRRRAKNEKAKARDAACRSEDLFGKIRLAKNMFEAGWYGCLEGDDYRVLLHSALRREGLWDMALGTSSRAFFSRAG